MRPGGIHDRRGQLAAVRAEHFDGHAGGRGVDFQRAQMAGGFQVKRAGPPPSGGPLSVPPGPSRPCRFAIDRQAGVAEIGFGVARGVVGRGRVGVQQDRVGRRARGFARARGGGFDRCWVRCRRPRCRCWSAAAVEREGVRGVGTTAGSLGGLIVCSRVAGPCLCRYAAEGRLGGVVLGVVVGGGVFSVEPRRGRCGGAGVPAGTCAISTCVGGLLGFWLSAAYAAVPAPAKQDHAGGRQRRQAAASPPRAPGCPARPRRTAGTTPGPPPASRRNSCSYASPRVAV